MATNYFLNQTLKINTHLSAIELLHECLIIEKKAGRTRTVKWGNRSLDIDLLFYGNEIINTPSLKVPHPEIANRLFVLIPLLEIDPQFIHPMFHISVEELRKIVMTIQRWNCI
ncbi:MAG: 2-amino-4-hydroxy-6-hydroxymethyldihydropteridine diphosphokinase [Chitinophagales bacterium]|nr:2-amino-4-hydroxy-6-hydroxymethyldihydropteridine diphosphokinase [Chitinophagales bacterium]